ncbi:unnamed protein product [Effrenium voratum]|nr:unnamed protein product [Effrenium voratum]|mmetsp:Transcript_106004/g.252972  ORF Transcript_106004/g.252972 Transcript_106004/m.252972 type:complete len:545 (+) Transcript_106004:90-1724(+)
MTQKRINSDEDDESIGLVNGKSRREECSWSCGLAQFLDDLSGAVGYKLLVLLFFVQHVGRGFVSDFTSQADPYVYKTYSVPAPVVQIFSGITQLPWALKPIIGLLSDSFPIGGYHKFPYMCISVVAGTIALLVVGAMPHDLLPVPLLVTCLFLMQSQLSVCDILSEAKYAEKIQELPAYGPHVLSYVWFGMNIGSLLGMSLSGLVLAVASPKLPYLISALPAALIMIPLLLGFLEEKEVSADEAAEARRRISLQPEAIFLSLLMCAVCVGLTVTGLITSNTYINAAAATAVFFLVGVAFTVLLSPTVAKFNLWSLLQTSMTLSTSGASFYFMTDTPEQYPEGPHFSPFFYNSVIGTVGALMSLAGIITFQRYMVGFEYRNLLLVTNIAYCLLNATDALLYSRFNQTVGIPDHVFVIGTGVVQNIMNQWQWLPQVIILSYFCPKGMEATMYALLAGCHNLGNTIASCWGALLLQSLGVTPSGAVGESDRFDNLWKASVVASCLPIITVVALFQFIPAVRQGDRVVDPHATATKGSLWKRFWGVDD